MECLKSFCDASSNNDDYRCPGRDCLRVPVHIVGKDTIRPAVYSLAV